MIEAAVVELTAVSGPTNACRAVGRPRATHYRRRRPSGPRPARERRPQPRALEPAERTQVLEVLHSEPFIDAAPPTVFATLLDQGVYLASVSTMYRLLHSVDEVRERRRVARHPAYVKPELIAWRPNMIWSWDITKLLGPQKWTYYYLYVILDIFSRYVVGWMLAGEESAALAERLLVETITKQGVDRDQLTIHADRGSSMASKPVAMLLADLGVTKSHSRPHCPNDNPFSESQFKTMKYRPEFPDRFGGPEDARAFCTRFFPWYNDDHRHSGIAYHTPADVHYGRAIALREQRAEVLTAAFAIHPERFVRKPPEPPRLPVTAWINKPLEEVTTTQ
jgi:putative transposase